LNWVRMCILACFSAGCGSSTTTTSSHVLIVVVLGFHFVHKQMVAKS
jgi:hypothetical protein